MKAKLITSSGDERNIFIKNIKSINSLICKNKYDSEFEINTIATEIAHEEDVIIPSTHIGGDVLLMPYCDEFYAYL